MKKNLGLKYFSKTVLAFPIIQYNTIFLNLRSPIKVLKIIFQLSPIVQLLGEIKIDNNLKINNFHQNKI